MKKIILTLMSITMLSTSALASSADNVVATYKDSQSKEVQIKESQIMKQFQPALDTREDTKGKKFSELASDFQETLVRGYANSKLIEQEALNSGIEKSADFQEKLNNMKIQLLSQDFVDQYLKKAITEAAIDKEFQLVVDNYKGKKAIRVRHILVDSEAKALEIKKSLNKGVKFSTLVKESKDESTKAKGGEIDGFIIEGSGLPVEFENAALNLKKNQTSAPVKTQFGWHILEAITDKTSAKIPTKEEARVGIINKLSKDAITEYFTELEKKADLKLSLPTPKVTPSVTDAKTSEIKK